MSRETDEGIAPPLVSVLIASYNHRAFIRETLESVLAQDYPRLRIVVADDGSRDGTQEILRDYAERFPDRVTCLLSPVNTGISENVNRALAACHGPYIALLGGDDLMLPGKLSRQVAFLEARPDAAGCAHDTEVFESESGRTFGRFSSVINREPGYREGGPELWLREGYWVLPSSLVVRAEAVPAHGWDTRLRFLADVLFLAEVFQHGRCCVLDEVLGKYRRHGGSATASQALMQSTVEETLICMSILNARYPDLYPYTRRRTRNQYLAEANRSLARGDRARFLRYLWIAFRMGAVVQAAGLFIAGLCFRNFLAGQIYRPLHERPGWFLRLVNFMKRL